MIIKIFVLVLLWAAYFGIHSLLASLAIKRWFARILPTSMPYYRLGFNVVATLFVIFPVAFMYINGGEPIWQWLGVAKWLANGVAVAAILTFYWTLRYYDMREFLGIKQSVEQQRDIYDQETFKLSPLHRYVRHPWYFLALLIIWSRDMDVMYLTSAIMVSLYFALGSKLEEKKLIAYHGERYRMYCQKVPGLIPRPWRHLTKTQALQLQAASFKLSKHS